MKVQETVGGFAGNPNEALTPAASGGCCGSTSASGNDVADTCCGTPAEAAESGGCCGTTARAEAIASGAGCCG